MTSWRCYVCGKEIKDGETAIAFLVYKLRSRHLARTSPTVDIHLKCLKRIDFLTLVTSLSIDKPLKGSEES